MLSRLASRCSNVVPLHVGRRDVSTLREFARTAGCQLAVGRRPTLTCAGPYPHLSTAVRSRTSIPEGRRQAKTWKDRERLRDSSEQAWWVAAGLMAVFGFVWALVPLYKLYCQSQGEGQAVQQGHKEYSAPPEPDSKAAKRLIQVDFTGTVHMSLPWEFVPQQRKVVVGLGETALAFYRAKNNSDKPIIGVSVYHMLPPEAGLYFNKIQCFCFDEQLINPGEEVDLPIFFFIDPLMAEDSRFETVNKITLSYLFFESDSDIPEGYENYMKAVPTTKAPPGIIPAVTPTLAN